VPVRTCIGCGKKRPKREILRLVSTESGLEIGDVEGRGFYLCRDVDCLVKAVKGGRMKRFLGRSLSDLESDDACGKGVICCSCTGGDPIA